MALESIYQLDRPLILGHRGASAYAPQNTIPAFELAIAQGADGVEFDVHLSSDGHAVVIHDFTVDHTTDGTGDVDAMTLDQLKALDAGTKFDAKFAGTRVPTLDEVFQVVKDMRAINVEIKAPTDNIEHVVYGAIKRHNLADRVIVSSFNPLILHRMRKAAPEVAIGFLYAPGYDFSAMMADLPHEARHPMHPMIDKVYMQQARFWGYRVNTWTVNDPQRALELAELGVDAIISDNPDLLLRALDGETA